MKLSFLIGSVLAVYGAHAAETAVTSNGCPVITTPDIVTHSNVPTVVPTADASGIKRGSLFGLMLVVAAVAYVV